MKAIFLLFISMTINSISFAQTKSSKRFDIDPSVSKKVITMLDVTCSQVAKSGETLDFLLEKMTDGDAKESMKKTADGLAQLLHFSPECKAGDLR